MFTDLARSRIRLEAASVGKAVDRTGIEKFTFFRALLGAREIGQPWLRQFTKFTWVSLRC